jgi:hypothetical protein
MRTIPFFLLASLALSGCRGGVVGSGHEKSAGRKIDGAFTRVALRGAFSADVRVGLANAPQVDKAGEIVSLAGEPGVVISGDDNLLEHVRTRVESGVLVVATDPDIRQRAPLRVIVFARSIEGLSVDGAVDVQLEDIPADAKFMTNGRFELTTSGASRITAVGGAGILAIDASGASEIDARRFNARSVVVRASGAVHANVLPQDALEAHLSGACVVEHPHNPLLKMSRDTSGASQIIER